MVKMIVVKEGWLFVLNYFLSFVLFLGCFNGLNMNGENWKWLCKFVISYIMCVDLFKECMVDIEDFVVCIFDFWVDDEGCIIYVEDEIKMVC